MAGEGGSELPQFIAIRQQFDDLRGMVADPSDDNQVRYRELVRSLKDEGYSASLAAVLPPEWISEIETDVDPTHIGILRVVNAAVGAVQDKKGDPTAIDTLRMKARAASTLGVAEQDILALIPAGWNADNLFTNEHVAVSSSPADIVGARAALVRRLMEGAMTEDELRARHPNMADEVLATRERELACMRMKTDLFPDFIDVVEEGANDLVLHEKALPFPREDYVRLVLQSALKAGASSDNIQAGMVYALERAKLLPDKIARIVTACGTLELNDSQEISDEAWEPVQALLEEI